MPNCLCFARSNFVCLLSTRVFTIEEKKVSMNKWMQFVIPVSVETWERKIDWLLIDMRHWSTSKSMHPPPYRVHFQLLFLWRINGFWCKGRGGVGGRQLVVRMIVVKQSRMLGYVITSDQDVVKTEQKLHSLSEVQAHWHPPLLRLKCIIPLGSATLFGL